MHRSRQFRNGILTAALAVGITPLAFSQAQLGDSLFTAWFAARSFPYWHDAHGAVGKWQEMGPKVILHGWGDMENAGRMNALAVDPTNNNVVFAGAAGGGIWRSTDHCQTWQAVCDFGPSLNFGTITIDPHDHNLIYAGTGEQNNSGDSYGGEGLLRSIDGGNNWEVLGASIFRGCRFSRLICDPKRPGWLYAATSYGVFRSIDRGANWVKLLDGVSTDLVINPNSPNQLLATLGNSHGALDNGVYATDNFGQNWKRVTDGYTLDGRDMGRLALAQCRAYPNVVYLSVVKPSGALGFYRSTDFGRSWEERSVEGIKQSDGPSWYTNTATVSPVDPNMVFVTGATTYRTLDGGATWQDLTRSYAGGPIHPDHHLIQFDATDPSSVYLCTDGGVFRSDNNGDNFYSVSRGLGTVQFEFVDVHPNDPAIAYGGTQDNGTNKFEGDLAWPNVEAGDGGYTRVVKKRPNEVYAEYITLQMYKSEDAGKNWDWGITRGIDRTWAAFYAPFYLDPHNPDSLVAGSRRVWKTVDRARSWKAISPDFRATITALTIAPNNSDVIYAGTSNGSVWVTAKSGNPWYRVTDGLPAGPVSDICIDPRNARHAYASFSSWSIPGLYETTDAGGHWQNISENMPFVPCRSIALDPNDPDRIFLGTDIGLFVTDKAGLPFSKFGKGLPVVSVVSIIPNTQTGLITVGTHGRGAWRIQLPGNEAPLPIIPYRN